MSSLISQFSQKSGRNNSRTRDLKGNGNSGFLNWARRHQKLLLGTALLSFFIAWMFPGEKSFQFADLKEGRVYIGPEIIAPFTFPVNKSPEEYAADVKKARREVAPVFRLQEPVASEQLAALNSFTERVGTVLRSSSVNAELVNRVFQEVNIAISEEDINNLLSGFGVYNNTASSTSQHRWLPFRTIAATVTRLLQDAYAIGILDVEKAEFSPSPLKISIRKNGQEMLESLEFFRGIREFQPILLQKMRDEGTLDEKQIKIAFQMILHFLAPNLLYEREETGLRMQEAVALVPLAKDQVLAGERIIDGHERITREHIDKLTSYAAAKSERGENQGLWRRLSFALSKWLMTLIVLGTLLGFLYHLRREIIDAPKQLLLIAILVLLIMALTFLVTQLNLSPLLIPAAAGAMVITVFFDVTVGLLFAFAISVLIGAMHGNEYGITYISLIVSAASILSVSRVRSRNWMLRSMAVVIVAYLLVLTVHDALNYLGLSGMARNWGLGFISGFIAPIIAYALVLLLERLFKMTTDMTLLELSDLNHPLLRQLAMMAPGTYHHSLSVGNMAEAATEAIGGNALLARVGAYYHDIGKIEKPEYFVENQGRGRNPHEKLTPTMSSLILFNHVRRGSDMARQYGLPPVIEAFIYEHHGTSLMGYFYQKAVEQSDGEPVSSTEFRYPGPRPRSRESAVVMLADAVEATSRTLKDPSPSRVKAIVEQIIDERFKSGELDNSPLTLQDLSRIGDAFQKSITARFHRRIAYPVPAEKDKAK